MEPRRESTPPQGIDLLAELLKPDIIEQIRHAEALCRHGGSKEDTEAACDILSELEFNDSMRNLQISGLGFRRTLTDTGYVTSATEFIDEEGCFVTFDIIDNTVHLVFSPINATVKDFVENEIVIAIDNLVRLSEIEEEEKSQTLASPQQQAIYAKAAEYIMSNYLSDNDLATQAEPSEIIALAADTIRAELHRDDNLDWQVFHDRILQIAAGHYYFVPNDVQMGLNECAIQPAEDPQAYFAQGRFVGYGMLEEFDSQHKPDATSLCYVLQRESDPRDNLCDGVYLVPVVNFADIPIIVIIDYTDDLANED
jgi:hypothetical protein